MQSIEQPEKGQAADPQLPAIAQIANHVTPNSILSWFFSSIFLLYYKREHFTFHMLIGLSQGRGISYFS